MMTGTVRGPSYYEILGVSQDASAEVIKKKYKVLALKFHPDRESSVLAGEAMTLITNAYEVLSDPKRRAAYDAYLNGPAEYVPGKVWHAKRGVLPVVRLDKRRIAMISLALFISFLVGFQAEAWQGDASVPDQFVDANSHYLSAITHEALSTIPLFIPGFGLAWGLLAGFASGFTDRAALEAVPSLQAQTGTFLLYFFLAVVIKLVACYIGMCRSLALVISIKRRRFSTIDRLFTQADICIAVILSLVVGLAEHAMVNVG